MPLYLNGTDGVYGVNGTNATPAVRGTDTNTGFVFGTDIIQVIEGGSESARFDASGNLLVGVTTANANGGVLQLKSGITFPATQVASTDANTLDDYEEGTFTPTFSGSTGNPTSYQAGGYYVKIGRIVFVTMYFNLTNASGGSGTGNIDGLPFTANNNSWGAGNRNSMLLGREDAITGVVYQAFVNGNSTFAQAQSTGGAGITWTTNYFYVFSGCYESAS